MLKIQTPFISTYNFVNHYCQNNFVKGGNKQINVSSLNHGSTKFPKIV